MNNQNNKINIRELLDNNPIGFYQKWVIFLCFLIVVSDGFDVAIMGFVAPALKTSWQLSNNALAPVLSAALIGLAIGAAITGSLADKFGRRKLLIINILIFGVFTVLVAHAHSVSEMVIYRLIAGCAMGGIMPNAATLATEFAPERKRALLVTIVFAGFTVGAAGGGFLAAWLIPNFGWQSVFYVGGVAPLILAMILWFQLPESMGFLIHQNNQKNNQYNQYNQQIINILQKCIPNLNLNHSNHSIEFILPNLNNQNIKNNQDIKSIKPIKIILNSHYRLGSILLWLAYFMHLFLVYLLGSWMPTMIKESGMTTAQASIISAMFQLGGPLGSVLLGWIMDKFNPNRVLMGAYLTGAILLIWISQINLTNPINQNNQIITVYLLLSILVFLMGAALNGGGTGMNALSSMFFPLQARATGNGLMHGLGRVGAILSTFVGAWLLNWGWGFSQVALFLSVPAGIVVISLFLKDMIYRKQSNS